MAGSESPRSLVTVVMDSEDMQRVLHRMAHEIIEKNRGTEKLALIGIRTRGEFLARRIRELVLQISGKQLPLGVMDVSFYRDDTRAKLRQPVVQSTEIGFDLANMNIVLIDDVLFTGRSVRAALDEIMDFGRPARIQLAVLVDRGHRELPIHADFIGASITTQPGETIRVRMTEKDGTKDEVLLVAN